MLFAPYFSSHVNVGTILDSLVLALQHPFSITWAESSPRFLLLFSLVYGIAWASWWATRRNLRPKEEYGSAHWGNVRELCKRYADPHGGNRIFTENFRMGLDGKKHRRSLNSLILGASGTGKSRSYIIPNILAMNGSMLILDPKKELLRSTGGVLKKNGYDVRVFDLIDIQNSYRYNPMRYLESDKDVLTLVDALIRNTTPAKSHDTDPFWTKAETSMFQALILYLMYEAPPEEQNLGMVMELLRAGEAREEEDFQSPLDILFERLAMREPDHVAVKAYRTFQQAAGKTAKSILVSAGVRLSSISLGIIESLVSMDELDLYTLGTQKVALYCCLPDNDKSLNYLAGLLIMQVIQVLYRVADQHGGSLPISVHLMQDEFANVPSLPGDAYQQYLSTCRSRNIHNSICIQGLSQLQAMFKDEWEIIVANCDELLVLGVNDSKSADYISHLMGKSTVDITTHGHTKGLKGSYSDNFQQVGRELMAPDEIRLMNNYYALLLIRGENPCIDRKFNLSQHPRYTDTPEGEGSRDFDYTQLTYPLQPDIDFDDTDDPQGHTLNPLEVHSD